MAAVGEWGRSVGEPVRKSYRLGGGKILREERGSVTVELFLVLPIAILVLVASIQLIGVARARIELQGAVREGARVAATTP
ncbi:MAG: TadE/TadG family type IV pilus assembly protein, partial [Acidimicrobiia bacterium]